MTFVVVIVEVIVVVVVEIQEAQLSQRDRAALRVIKYFAKSPKVIRV